MSTMENVNVDESQWYEVSSGSEFVTVSAADDQQHPFYVHVGQITPVVSHDTPSIKGTFVKPVSLGMLETNDKVFVTSARSMTVNVLKSS